MKTPLRIMSMANVKDTRATFSSSQRRLASRVVSLPGNSFCVAGKMFNNRDAAIAYARKLDSGQP